SLDAVRGDFFSRAIPLFESPPFRVLLHRDPAGDSVLLAANHAGCDGIGALRLLQSVIRAYAGVGDPTVDIAPAEAHRLAVPEADGRGLGGRVDDARFGLKQVAQARSRLTKVAQAGG